MQIYYFERAVLDLGFNQFQLIYERTNKIKVGTITSSNEKIYCRGAEIQIPDGLTMASFIKNGFSDELKLAGVYSDKSNIELIGNISNIDVNCNVGTANWTTEMEITIGQNEPFIIKNIYTYEGAIIFDPAYKNAQQALNSALQDFYSLIIKHPDFSKALSTPM